MWRQVHRGHATRVHLRGGMLKKFSQLSGGNLAAMPTRAGAAAVPTPPSPWHALQDCASKMVFPFAASGSASATLAAASEAEESPGSNGLRVYSSSSVFCFASCCATPGSCLSTYWLRRQTVLFPCSRGRYNRGGDRRTSGRETGLGYLSSRRRLFRRLLCASHPLAQSGWYASPARPGMKTRGVLPPMNS